MIDKPPHVDLLDELTLVVEEVEGSFEPTEQFHSLGVVADEGMDEPRRLVDEIAGTGDPVVFQVAHAAFQANHHHGTVVLVRANDARTLDPQYVAESVVAHIKCQMANRRARAERYPGTLLQGGAHKSAGYTVACNQVPEGVGHVQDLVGGGRRCRHGCWVDCRHKLSSGLEIDSHGRVPLARRVVVTADLACAIVG